ncbi:rhomboid family intramembrane serine protease [Microbacterium sp. NIBRBAC000506063]|uniref:rhomboid family intramembrane serine protease n=1 Tax=Microbacterium sp. NIBRBAC000506063 TaxID=2734618 RepID=UPI002948BF40|nr:rhomboid family intramembrane serine protease [Microbacterium sp. NIBRBAC000506063]
MTSADFARNRDNFCYRHPGTQSFVLCQRCMRTICADCQTQAPVGVICPECLKAQRKAESPAQRRARRQSRSMAAMFAGRPPTVTAAIVILTGFIGLLQMIPGIGNEITRALMFFAPSLYPSLNGGVSEPWRLLTPLLVHGGFFHLALNMLALYVIGRSLEPMLGKWRFLALYLISGLGGSVAVALISPLTPVVGASGAIFGLFGALLVIGRKAGRTSPGSW